MQNGRCCAFESRKLNQAELNYHPGETGLLAVVHALKIWRCYLEGNPDVVVATDHNPLVWLQTQSNLSPKQVRWMAYLQRFPFKWRYIPGRTNVADPLSRSPALRAIVAVTTHSRTAKDSAAAASASAAPDRGDLDPSPLPALLLPPDTAADETIVAAADDASHSRADRCLSPAVSGGMGGPALTEFETECVQQHAADPYFASDANTNAFRLERGLYFRGQALVIPDGNGLREKCLQAVHTSPYAGHCGFAKTRKLLARSFWWPNLNAAVKRFIAHCASCQRSKSPNDLPGGLLQPLHVPPGLWDSVSLPALSSICQGLSSSV